MESLESIRKALMMWGIYPFYSQVDNFFKSKEPHSYSRDRFMVQYFQQEMFLEADEYIPLFIPLLLLLWENTNLEGL